MKSHELMLISVYPEMLEDIQAVCQTMHIEPTILQWEIAQQGLLDKLNQMFLELPKPDVIISRGATAGMIEQYFPEIVSIRAEPDNLEILEILNKAREYGSRIGLILFDEYVDHYKIKTVEHLLDVEEVRIYPFRSRADIESQVLRGKRDGMDVMVGGGTLALRMGKQCGMNVCFVESGRLSLKKAIRQAESIIYARQREKLQLKCFSSAASSIQEGILSTENGTIVVANQEMGHILNINERLILNKKAEALPSSLMAPCILTFMFHDTADDGILKINGQNYYVKKSTARSKTNQRIIAVFQGTRNIQYQEQRVRSELRNNGFMAKYTFEDIVAESALMKSLMDKARLYASTNAGILINGNSGTGKELLAPDTISPSWLSTVQPSPPPFWKANYSVMRKEHFPEQKKEESADCSNWPIKVPSFWMKSIPCPLNCRVFCCVPFRRKKFEEWALKKISMWISASSPPATRTWKNSLRTANSGPTCTTA